MKLIYLYVGKKIHNIEDLGINLSQDFEVSYLDSHLLIKKKNKVKVYNSSIEELTVIVGRNGSGKSTLLDLCFYSKSEMIDSRFDDHEKKNHLPRRMFRLYHIMDEEQIGHFYIQDFSDTIFFADFVNNNNQGDFSASEFLLSYDYLKNEIIGWSICTEKNTLSKVMEEQGLSENKANVLYNISVQQSNTFSNLKLPPEIGFMNGRIIYPTLYALLNYAYDAARAGKNKESAICNSFENIPKGLRLHIDPPMHFIKVSNPPGWWWDDLGHYDFAQESAKEGFLHELLLRFLYDLQNPHRAYPKTIAIINNKARKFVADYCQTRTDIHLNQALLVYISAILHSCMGYNLSKEPSESTISPYVVIYHLAFVLAFADDEYGQFIDACFFNTVLGDNNWLIEEQKISWERAYRILQDKKSGGSIIKGTNWKNHISDHMLTKGISDYEIDVPLASYEKKPDELHEERNVIVDSLFRLIYIIERMEEDCFSKEERSRYLPQIWVSGISTGEKDFINLYASIYGGFLLYTR